MPTEVGFATKPALAGAMIEHALSAGVPAAWVAGDEVYGGDPKLAARVEAAGLGYVLAIASNAVVQLNAVSREKVANTAEMLPASAWEERSASAGAHGQRFYRWAWVDLHPPTTEQPPGGRGGCWSLLIRPTQPPGSWRTTAATPPSPPR